MNLATVTGEISHTQLTVEPSRRNWRVLSRSAPAGPIPESMTAPPRSVARRGFAYRAIAALVILAIALGYFAFEPLRRGTDTPRFVPGGVAPVGTPATPEPSPTIVPYSMEGHPIIGTWLVDYSDNPGTDTKIYSFSEFGDYGNINNFILQRVTIGEWRATGERTLELVCIEQMIHLHDLWDPELETIPYLLDTKVQFWRLSITVDETGNSFTGTGGFTYYNSDGTVIYPYREIQVIGTRMEVVALGTEDTPAP